MPYIPEKARESQSASAKNVYIPGSGESMIACKSGQNLNQVPQFISPELQARVDELKKDPRNAPVQAEIVESGQNQTILTEDLPVAGEDDWQWLRGEVDRRLKASDKFDLCLSFEQRGQLYRYREELRTFPDRVGRNWTRSSVAWPVLPNFSAI